ncbi:MAG: SMC-Scp complex subunit ScpB [Candidatus Omnitrophica bacterium]|nr:SMC-Scp complex subunit ScpB [Candidatus Omnitrophota bacterium]
MKTKTIIESLLFVNEKPLTVEEISEILGLDKNVIMENIEMLIKEYNERESGICIIKVAGGYQMCSHPENEVWVKKMYNQRYKQKLSTAALETLAIIAYKQPVTRFEIEAIRGVNVDGVIHHLLDLGLIKTAGRKEVVGRPFLYVTTRKFLEYFGLNSLNELPKIEEFITNSTQQLLFQQQNQTNVQSEEDKNITISLANNTKKGG